MGASTVAGVAAAAAPLWLWLAAISSLPHKEERFLYVVYPLVSSTTSSGIRLK